MKRAVFHGACTALVTPFREGYVNYCMFDRLLERQLEVKVNAVVVAGTTGEASTLKEHEKLALFRHTADVVGGSCKVVAGTGCNDTKASCELSQKACDCGVDALLCVTPYYNKCTQEGLLRHYESIAEASSLPVIIYNVPSRTNVNISPDTVRQLSVHPNIAGIKEADPDVAKVSALRLACGRDFSVYCGNDDRLVPFYAAGANGVISVFGNLYPEKLKALTDLCEQGAYHKAAALQAEYLPLMNALFLAPNPMPVKAALRLMGFDTGNCRLPLTSLSEAQESTLRALLN